MAVSEQIVLVDKQGISIGEADKLATHHAHTPLHLAFSIYIFNNEGRFLVTQRAFAKKVWPGVWTNSCCGHPAPNETFKAAIARRLDYELGMTADNIQQLVKDYTYTTTPYNGIIENEFCPIFVGKSQSQPRPNPDEVAEYKWMSWKDYISESQNDPADVWSWWCKDQLRYLKDLPLLNQYVA